MKKLSGVDRSDKPEDRKEKLVLSYLLNFVSLNDVASALTQPRLPVNYHMLPEARRCIAT